MKKQLISIALLATILLQSCVAYQKTSISLDEAKNKGKVKVMRRTGNYSKFKNIHMEDGVYYGNINNKEVLLKVSQFSAIYLEDKEKSKKQTIKLAVGIVVTIGIFFLIGAAITASSINKALTSLGI